MAPLQKIAHDNPSTADVSLNGVDAPPVVAPSASGNSTLPEARVLKWNKEQYLQMAELGWFEGRHVELIEGEIIEMAAMGDRHWLALVLVSDELRRVFSEGYFLSGQSPLRLSSKSEPEPDVAVIQGRGRDYQGTIPSTAALVVEISDSTLSYDRTQKAGLYARAGIAEYWILNLMDNQLEVHRKPGARPDQPFGFGYLNLSFHFSGEIVSPLAAPEAQVAVADLLP